MAEVLLFVTDGFIMSRGREAGASHECYAEHETTHSNR